MYIIFMYVYVYNILFMLDRIDTALIHSANRPRIQPINHFNAYVIVSVSSVMVLEMYTNKGQMPSVSLN